MAHTAKSSSVKSTTVKSTGAMISGMDPVLMPETYVFCTTTDAHLAAHAKALALATFAEAEGTSLILTADLAASLGFALDQPMARITLNVNSALDGVGLTAAVATTLAQAGIACNMVAAFHHDHAFIPAADAETALDLLKTLAARSVGSDPS